MSAVAEASPSIRARDNLSALGLHEMAASLPDYVRMVSAGERDFCSALEEMTRVEVAAREARIVRQRIRSSGFPYVKSLADFDWDFQPSVPRLFLNPSRFTAHTVFVTIARQMWTIPMSRESIIHLA